MFLYMQYIFVEEINSSEINHFNLPAWCVIQIFKINFQLYFGEL